LPLKLNLSQESTEVFDTSVLYLLDQGILGFYKRESKSQEAITNSLEGSSCLFWSMLL